MCTFPRLVKKFWLNLYSAIPTYHRAKMCWRIICEPKALWVLVLKGLYFPHQDFLSTSKGPKPSWAWSSLLEGRNIISEFSRWQVLNGESIATWSDRWVPGVPGSKLSASHLVASEYEPYQRVSYYLINWDVPYWNLSPIFHHLSSYKQVAVTSLPLTSVWELDKLVWQYERNEIFSVKSGYYKIHEVRSSPSLQHSHWSHCVHLAVWSFI